MATYVLGDVHGQRDQAAGLLRAARLIDARERWSGGDATLWFIGDFLDRGADGIGAVELAMRLQQEAPTTGGEVGALMGNHEVLFLSAYHFGDRPSGGQGGTFRTDWLHNGGQQRDLERLEPHHIAWLSDLPAMAHVEDRLLMHADSRFYAEYGRSVQEVNAAFRALMHQPTEDAWDTLLGQFSERLAFRGQRGAQHAREFLDMFGGRQIVHGHTPLWKIVDLPAEQIKNAVVYADSLCVNVDGGMITGGPGFVYRLPPLSDVPS